MAESEEFCLFEDSDLVLENHEVEEHSSIAGEEGLESVAGCTCRSQCSRKLKTSANGKVTGCPCKGYGLLCGANYSCGTKNKSYKNKINETNANNPQEEMGNYGQMSGPSASGTEANEERSVEIMLEALDHQTLLEVAKIGFMSRGLQLADLIAVVQNNLGHQPPATPVNPAPPFCVCGHCREMLTDKERACCKEKRLCRSITRTFQNICVDSDNLATVIRSLADTYVFTPVYMNKEMRHATYMQYIMWQHGHLGMGHRKVIPSYCVWEIRKHYLSPDGNYTGYKDH